TLSQFFARLDLHDDHREIANADFDTASQSAEPARPGTTVRPLPSAIRTVVTLLAAWQALVWLLAPPRYILPAPLDVVGAFARQPGYLLDNTLVTLGEIAAGFAAGTVLG